MKVIIDAEFNGLEPTKIWCIVTKEVNTGVRRIFKSSDASFVQDFLSHSRDVTCFVGHHIIGYDSRWINYHLDKHVIDPAKCIDTLVTSRLIEASKNGGHSVENWGKKFPKIKQKVEVGKDEWDDPTKIDLYVERCITDVDIQYEIYKDLLPYLKDKVWAKSLRVEHDIAVVCLDMHENGFKYNKAKGDRLLTEIETEMAELEEEIRETVPPVLSQDGEATLKRNKDGSISKKTMEVLSTGLDHRGCKEDLDSFNFNPGSNYHRFSYEPFNPGSPKQRIELLNKSGWRPYEKTKGHIQCERDLRNLSRGPEWQRKANAKDKAKLEQKLERFKVYGWKCNEDNLGTLPPDAPTGVRLLARWLTLEGRRGDLAEWSAAYVPTTGRIHGNFNGIGSWTQRMSHTKPNQGNIFSSFDLGQCRGSTPSPVEGVKLKYNNTLRSLWEVEEGAYLVGTDAEGIQMRVFAEYVEDEAFTEALVNGDKKLGTDVHSFNRALLGAICSSRDDAKTFIYAWLLGAGLEKIQQILSCSRSEASDAVAKFVAGVPGINELKRGRIPADAKRGFFIGLDGRKVINRSNHLMLAGYLQNGEACVMKHANTLWRKEVEAEGIRYKQVNFVHDEWQTEAYTMEEAIRIGVLQCKAIEETGVNLGMVVRLAGETKIGKNWYETH
jgi:DNA polymerase I-like protein with 3'-5' exonuclease and polymerase domains